MQMMEGVCSYGLGPLVAIGGTMNGGILCNILDKHMLPTLASFTGRTLVSSRKTMLRGPSWLGVMTMGFSDCFLPAQCPDRSPVG